MFTRGEPDNFQHLCSVLAPCLTHSASAACPFQPICTTKSLCGNLFSSNLDKRIPSHCHSSWVHLWSSLFLPRQLFPDSPICATSSVSCSSLLSSGLPQCQVLHLLPISGFSDVSEPGVIKACEQMKFRRECYSVWVLPHPSWVVPQEGKRERFWGPWWKGHLKWLWGPRHEKVVKWLTYQ